MGWLIGVANTYYSRLWVWQIGMANTKATIVDLIATAVRFLAEPSPFIAVFDSAGIHVVDNNYKINDYIDKGIVKCNIIYLAE